MAKQKDDDKLSKIHVDKNIPNGKKLERERQYYTKILDDMDPTVKQVQNNIKKFDKEFSIDKAERLEKTTFIDFKKVQRQSSIKAARTVFSYLNFFIQDPMLKQTKFVKRKVAMDKTVLSKLLFQIETSEYATIKLLELIDEGNTNPRNFEVLGGLQKSHIDLVKFLVQMQNVMEMTYRNLFENYQIAPVKQGQLESGDVEYDDEEMPDYSDGDGSSTKVYTYKNVLKTLKGNKDE